MAANPKGKDKPLTKWTNDAHKASRHSGWAKEGIKRYNELKKLVIEDRKANVAMEVEYLKKKKEESLKRKRGKKRKVIVIEEEYIEEDDFGWDQTEGGTVVGV